MPETILTSNLIATIDDCIQKANIASMVDHHGMAGTLREIFLTNLIVPLLPEGFKAGTGKIIDRKGKLSSQTDIIIYNKSRFPPLMFDETQGVFPVDSVYYAIEVKSTVTATEINDSIAKAEILRSLYGNPVNIVLFGFGTDIKTKESDLLRIQQAQTSYSFPPVNIYCTVNNGYCYHDKSRWQVFDKIERRAEVIGLLIGIINTLVNIGIRSRDFPPGKYLAWWET